MIAIFTPDEEASIVLLQIFSKRTPECDPDLMAFGVARGA
jgi:hypothetical protein